MDLSGAVPSSGSLSYRQKVGYLEVVQKKAKECMKSKYAS